MRLNRSDLVAGLSATDARMLMRVFQAPRPEGAISELIDTAGRSDSQIARALAEAGYLEEHRTDTEGETWWLTTTAGNALAQASFARPITRATAQRHLDAVIARAKQYNADSTHLVEISEIVVFGSYLDPGADYLGDVDLAVSFHDRLDRSDQAAYAQAILDYAYASGRRFATFVERLVWPRQEAMQLLRNRSGAINITEENVRTLTDRWQVVYTLHQP